MTFGEKIKHLRIAKEWSQVEVAKKIGVSKQTINKYESNINKPTFEVLKNLAKIFDTSLDYLLLGEIKNIPLNDKELLEYFKLAEQLSSPKKEILKVLIDAFVKSS